MKIGYARVSTQDQTLDLQIDALNNATCDRILSDTISGVNSSKPGLDQALQILREGDTLVVWKLDRLGRNTKGLLTLVEDFKRRNIQFESLTDKIDTSTPMGQFCFTVLAGMAQMERELIRERTMAGLLAARARGRLGGRRPVLGTDKRVQRLFRLSEERDPSTLRLIYTVDEIIDMMRDAKTGKRMGRSTYYRYVNIAKRQKATKEGSVTTVL